MITQKEKDELIRLARQAREKAHAPYSGYMVGAAVLTASKKYYSGCNVENAALTITSHAEGNAINTAVADGEKEFLALAVFTDGDPPPFPCAICRQSMAEFNLGDMLILAANMSGAVREANFSDLYPEMFGPHRL